MIVIGIGLAKNHRELFPPKGNIGSEITAKFREALIYFFGARIMLMG